MPKTIKKLTLLAVIVSLSSFASVRKGENFEGRDLRDERFTRALGDANFNRANLEGAFFNGAYLAGSTFNGANLRDVRMTGNYLCPGIFKKADLTGAHIDMWSTAFSDFSGANLSDATIYLTHFEWNTVNGSNLAENLTGAIYNKGTRIFSNPFGGNAIDVTEEAIEMFDMVQAR